MSASDHEDENEPARAGTVQSRASLCPFRFRNSQNQNRAAATIAINPKSVSTNTAC